MVSAKPPVDPPADPPSDPPSDRGPDPQEEEDALLLPTPDDRDWILARLAELVAARGHEHLTLAPLVEPTQTHFPDRWQGGDASLVRLVRRLLVYADLEDARVEVVVHEDVDVGGPVGQAGIGGPMWLVRKQGETLHFAARVSALKDPIRIVSAAARAVTEGYRAWHRLSVSDAMTEQKLVDITTVYLGFGVLTTDARVRHSSIRTDGFRVQRNKTQLGVVPGQALAFALAAVMTVRELDARQTKTVLRGLQANPAGFVRAALKVLAAWQPPVREVLAIPPPTTWAEPPSLTDLTASLSGGEAIEADDAAAAAEEPRGEDRGVLGTNAGQPVFRVERSMALRLAKMLALPVVLVGMLAGRMQMGIEIEMWKVGGAAAVLGILGLAIGRMLPDSRCSEPKCGKALRTDDETCPRCGGTVVGVIGHPKERLAAEEAWREANPE